MAYPTIYDIEYSYTGFSASLGDGSFPGTQLDADLAGLDTGQQNIVNFMQSFVRSDGIIRVEALPTAVDLTAYTDQAIAAAGTATTKAGEAATASGIAVSAAGTATTARNEAQALVDSAIYGQCRLNYVSTTSVRLDRHDGALLTIEDNARVIPATGPTLAATGLTPGTTYYVYAYWTGSAIALEASTTAPATHTNGQRIKTDDATRSLVGMVNPVTGPNFADGAAARRVLSWFNRRPKGLHSAFTTSRTTTSATLAEVNSENRVAFLSWGEADESFGINTAGSNSATDTIAAALALDAIGAPLVYVAGSTRIAGGSRWDSVESAISAGLHTLLFGGMVGGAGTATFTTDSEIRGQIRG